MTALQPSFAPSFHGHGPFDTMPDQPSDQNWQHQHHNNDDHSHQPKYNYIPPQMPMLTNQWAPHTQPPSNNQQQQQQQLLGMTGMDRRFYHEDASPYMAYTSTGTSNNLMSSCFPTENTWSDMDMGTPSNFDSPNEPVEPFLPSQPAQSRLQPPPRLPSNARHPNAHAPSVSPHQHHSEPMTVDRPTMPGRSVTEPTKTQVSKPSKPSIVKASASDESDDDFIPSESNLNSNKPPATATNRGRKRQRIPHTAVERRYRENLNAHLERLRQTVPALASRRASAGVALTAANAIPMAHAGHRASDPNPAPIVPSLALSLSSDGAKPSKCEILNGAIEHIGAVERENLALREEVKELRVRVEDLQRWYSATLRSAGGNGPGGYAG